MCGKSRLRRWKGRIRMSQSQWNVGYGENSIMSGNENVAGYRGSIFMTLQMSEGSRQAPLKAANYEHRTVLIVLRMSLPILPN